MATMNISLPDKMKEWVEQQVATGRYANASDFVRDVIREQQEKETELSQLRAEIQKGLDSGISPRSRSELADYVRSRASELIEGRNGRPDNPRS